MKTDPFKREVRGEDFGEPLTPEKVAEIVREANKREAQRLSAAVSKLISVGFTAAFLAFLTIVAVRLFQ